jgi:hypothetical protein
MRAIVGVVVGLLLAGSSGAVSAQDLSGSRPLFEAGAPTAPAPDAVASAMSLPDPGAFDQQPAGPAPTPRHTGIHALGKDLLDDFKHLPSKENFIWAGVAGGLALAVHPVDDNVMNGLAYDSKAQSFFKLGKYLGQSYVLIPVAIGVYATGRIKDQPKVSHVGMDLIQALLMAEAITQTLKYTTRRERPDGSGKNSFPSGHAADTFAFATAFERHIGWKGAVPAYLFSSYVAISRLPDNRHWLSDTVFGAGVGIIAGRTATRHGAKYPMSAAIVRGGVEIMFSRNYAAN